MWYGDGPELTLEWSEGDLFAVPLNAWHEHFNDDRQQPARLYTVENVILEQMFDNLDFVYNTDCIFPERWPQ